MWIDKRTEFADGVSAITSGTTTLVFGSQIDTGNLTKDLGNGQDLYLVVQVDTSIIGTTGAGSFTVQLVTDSNVNMTTSPVVLASSASYVTNTTAQTGSTAGSTLWSINLPQGSYKQYLGLKIVPVTYAISAGTISAFLTPDKQGNAVYPDALGAGQ